MIYVKTIALYRMSIDQSSNHNSKEATPRLKLLTVLCRLNCFCLVDYGDLFSHFICFLGGLLIYLFVSLVSLNDK